MRIIKTGNSQEYGLPFQITSLTVHETRNLSNLLRNGELIKGEVCFDVTNTSQVTARELNITIKLALKKKQS